MIKSTFMISTGQGMTLVPEAVKTLTQLKKYLKDQGHYGRIDTYKIRHVATIKT